jgi:peptidoglycan-associated lipoprotein
MATLGLGLGPVRAQEQSPEISEHQFLYEHIYFKKDSTVILPSSDGALNRKTLWLKQNPDARVMIEGHCDSRGSEISNLILGEARAGRIKTYLVRQGIEASRLLAISYGEADPVDPGKNEEAYSKNRRVRFVLQ